MTISAHIGEQQVHCKWQFPWEWLTIMEFPCQWLNCQTIFESVGDRPQKKPKAVQRMKKVTSTPSDGIRTVNETEHNDLMRQNIMTWWASTKVCFCQHWGPWTGTLSSVCQTAMETNNRELQSTQTTYVNNDKQIKIILPASERTLYGKLTCYAYDSGGQEYNTCTCKSNARYIDNSYRIKRVPWQYINKF